VGLSESESGDDDDAGFEWDEEGSSNVSLPLNV
jgi:hypothetical protein